MRYWRGGRWQIGWQIGQFWGFFGLARGVEGGRWWQMVADDFSICHLFRGALSYYYNFIILNIYNINSKVADNIYIKVFKI